MDIFVGSLSFKVKESELREAFEKYGEVVSAKIIIDKITRQSKGFGFVEMPNEEHGNLTISQLNGAEMYGRPLVVNRSQKKDAPERRDAPAFRPQGGAPAPRPQGGTPSNDRYRSPNDVPGSGGSGGHGKSDFGKSDKGFGGRSRQDHDRGGRGEYKKGGARKYDPRGGDDDDW
jgi:RNA recognition motif-containing protein